MQIQIQSLPMIYRKINFMLSNGKAIYTFTFAEVYTDYFKPFYAQNTQ